MSEEFETSKKVHGTLIAHEKAVGEEIAAELCADNPRLRVFALNTGETRCGSEALVEQFRDAVLSGLQLKEKEIPSRFFYDQRGSELFEEICGLDEYYLRRRENEILSRLVEDRSLARTLGEGVTLIEPGAASCEKAELVLDALDKPAAFVGIDISTDFIREGVTRVAGLFPEIDVIGIAGDHDHVFDEPEDMRGVIPEKNRIIFFPGSSIGNKTLDESALFLKQSRAITKKGGGLLIGIDLKKDPDILIRAYKDAKGVTTEFNLNLLNRINSELLNRESGDIPFVVSQFSHQAVWNSDQGRMESYLVSNIDQMIRIGDTEISFAKGERMRTEYSYKYEVSQFSEFAAKAGFSLEKTWTDSQGWYAILFLR